MADTEYPAEYYAHWHQQQHYEQQQYDQQYEQQYVEYPADEVVQPSYETTAASAYQPEQYTLPDDSPHPPYSSGTSFPVDYQFSQSPVDQLTGSTSAEYQTGHATLEQQYSCSEPAYPQYALAYPASSSYTEERAVSEEQQWSVHAAGQSPWSPENPYSPESVSSMDTSLVSPTHEYASPGFPPAADYSSDYSHAHGTSSYDPAQQETIQYSYRPDVHAYSSVSGSALVHPVYSPASASASTSSSYAPVPPQWMTEQAIAHAPHQHQQLSHSYPHTHAQPSDTIDVNPPVVPSQADLRYAHHPYRAIQSSAALLGHDSLAPFRVPSRAFRPGPLPSHTQSQSVLRFGSGSRAPVKQPHERKPVLACLFCRGRKIACGQARVGSEDRTCNQCARRQFECVYPKESRRGFRKGKRKAAKEEPAVVPVAEPSSSTTSSSGSTAPDSQLQPKVEEAQ
ncbi:hypothetical protein BOTBODRAFT_25595 [Botryobasidium botryosum FD-172 SS1]|uniref:Zn(2)-C6 fungal-type domain-containing protein n=1 Tax=Botryobasidium botryosum (strain FD-172 SS1) TaxID=930990 RepID=A0A067NAK5_BOTB1|nr:hypothetical protein BOTBODRAFT_25595 [Botryobasidium botryosum FD-172 SS1]